MTTNEYLLRLLADGGLYSDDRVLGVIERLAAIPIDRIDRSRTKTIIDPPEVWLEIRGKEDAYCPLTSLFVRGDHSDVSLVFFLRGYVELIEQADLDDYLSWDEIQETIPSVLVSPITEVRSEIRGKLVRDVFTYFERSRTNERVPTRRGRASGLHWPWTKRTQTTIRYKPWVGDDDEWPVYP